MNLLIVIDMQKKYMSLYDSGLVERVNARIRAALREGGELVYVNNPGAAADADAYGFAEGLEIVSKHIFYKAHQSVMTSPEFMQFLEEMGKRGSFQQGPVDGRKEEQKRAESAEMLELIGADGRVCVAQSALDLAACGYRVSVNLSCVGARDDPFYRQKLEQMKEAGVELT